MKTVEPVLTTNGTEDIDQSIVVNGNIDIRKTHPNLYLMVMTLGAIDVLLAANFYWLNPTFEVYHLKNYVWASVFLTLGLAKWWFLNFKRSLRVVRMTMAFAVSFLVFFAIGTAEPWLDGVGSLQLPIMYLGMAAVQIPMLLEPFLNPWTARR